MDKELYGSSLPHIGQPFDWNNKSISCEAGEREEKKFLSLYGDHFNLILHPDKEDSPFGPDFLNIRTGNVADLKTRNDPFFVMAGRYGYDPQYAVTINCNDCVRYAKKHPNIEIYYWVKWNNREKYGVKVKAMEGVYFSPFKKLMKFIDTTKVYKNPHRENNKGGNKQDNYFIDVRDMEDVTPTIH